MSAPLVVKISNSTPTIRVRASVTGPAGPTGPAGGNETYTFNTPATTHVVNHTLGFKPGGVLVTTLAGVRIIGATVTQVSTARVDVNVNPATAVIVDLS